MFSDSRYSVRSYNSRARSNWGTLDAARPKTSPKVIKRNASLKPNPRLIMYAFMPIRRIAKGLDSIKMLVTSLPHLLYAVRWYKLTSCVKRTNPFRNPSTLWRQAKPMQATLRKLLITLPITLALSTAAWAQTTAIEGDVKGTDGKPLQGATVKIARTDIKANYKVKTDKKGHYYYGGLSIGTYNVTLEVDGMDVDQ